MNTKYYKARILVIGLLIAGITFLHYSTQMSAQNYHIFYQGLYFLPVLLAGFWFGLRGGLATSLSITLLYSPFTLIHWNVFSAEDFNNVQVMALYNLVAVIMGILSDREKKNQIRLRESESFAAAGKAASFLANDMKSALVGIGGLSRSIKSQSQENDGRAQKLDMIFQETQWLELLLHEILSFSSPLELHLSKQSIQPVINESLALVRDQAREKNVTLQCRTLQDHAPFYFDPLRLRQVFVNLLRNAIEASPEGASVQISFFQIRRKLVIEVGDQGVGIPPDKRKEVFLPFYSTKERGAGLGLSVAKKIVDAHRGRVQILASSEKGIIFRIILPLNRKQRYLHRT